MLPSRHKTLSSDPSITCQKTPEAKYYTQPRLDECLSKYLSATVSKVVTCKLPSHGSEKFSCLGLLTFCMCARIKNPWNVIFPGSHLRAPGAQEMKPFLSEQLTLGWWETTGTFCRQGPVTCALAHTAGLQSKSTTEAGARPVAF